MPHDRRALNIAHIVDKKRAILSRLLFLRKLFPQNTSPTVR